LPGRNDDLGRGYVGELHERLEGFYLAFLEKILENIIKFNNQLNLINKYIKNKYLYEFIKALYYQWNILLKL